MATQGETIGAPDQVSTYNYTPPEDYGPPPVVVVLGGRLKDPTCHRTAAERFGVEEGRCAVADGTRIGTIACNYLQGTCGEAGMCIMGIGYIADSAEALLAREEAISTKPSAA